MKKTKTREEPASVDQPIIKVGKPAVAISARLFFPWENTFLQISAYHSKKVMDKEIA